MKILIVGCGQVGYYLCERLSAEGHEVVLVDRDPENLRRAQDRLNVLGIHGNGASAESLEQAGIKDTDFFIAVTDSDEVNILSCLLAREYEVSTRIARVKNIEYTAKSAVLSKEKLGIDLLINPEDAVADELVKISCRTGSFDVAEFVEGQIQFIGYRINQESPLCEMTLRELGEIRGMYRFVVAAISRGDQTIIPRGEDTIQAGDSIFVMAHHKDLPAIQYMLHLDREKKRPGRRAFILGGGHIGQMVARSLESMRFDVKLVDRDMTRCRELAAKLKKTVVLQTEGIDIRTLLDEGVGEADVFVAVTENDETNILSSLLCKQHGTKRTLALINTPELLKLAPSLGIDACISPRIAAAGAILKYVRRGEIISMAAIEGSNSEVLEIEILPNTSIVGTPLKELNFPRGAIIGAIVDGDKSEIPTGESRLRPGNRVVVFALPEALGKVGKFFE